MMTRVNQTQGYASILDDIGLYKGQTQDGVAFEFAGEVTYIHKQKEAEDYLIDPFIRLIESPDYPNDTNNMKIITGVTGQGKTYLTATKFIPTLFEKFDLDLTILTAPQGVVIDYDLLSDAASDIPGVAFVTHPKEAIRALKRGRKALLAVTNQSAFVAAAGSELFTMLAEKDYKFAVFIDEAHMWTISNWQNISSISGRNNCDKYSAKLYTNVAKIASKSPHIFGITATPNREHLDVVKPIGNMKFSVINKVPPKNVMIYRSAWFNSAEFYDRRGSGRNIQNTFYRFLDKMNLDIDMTGNKKTMMISCCRSNSKQFRMKDVLDMLKDYYEKYMDDPSERSIIEMSAEGNFLCSPDDYYRSALSNGDEEAKELLNDPTHPAKYALIIEKGKAGMNIFNLKYLFSFRDSKPITDSGELVIEQMIQTIGRLVRLYVGMDNTEFTKKYGYDLRSYIDQCSDDDKCRLLINNSFNVCVPDTDHWIEAVNQFSKVYSSSKIDAFDWIETRKLSRKH